MGNVKNLRFKLEQLKGEKANVKKEMTALRSSVVLLTNELSVKEKAREILREVGLKTQQNLQYHISDITSLALSAVFTDPYELKVDFVQRRNKTECDLMFVRNEKEIDPLDSSGYGAVDIASFALRIASWSLKIPHTRPVIILDEPMRFLSQDRQVYASKMIKELSDKLGLQFLIVTHEDVLAEHADRVFVVEMTKKGNNKISKIRQS
jgi:DNA repair exonuclease SbcCD ATPase subunit